ncbi:uncharacterized protein BJX67DRAFT_386495 [Aspergillus lucknowensis]|uniref:Cytochrome P450 n=1 Tax=Aspergillus lucknowensis TaxID=176173 RepID=A0ABR4L5V3_9EURO
MENFLPPDGGSRTAFTGVGIVILYSLGLIVHRLLLSPVAGFPWPKLAAVTNWYELYYDVVKKGKYVFEIEKMHDSYGPIVRISPHELSIRDPDYYNELYVSGSVRPSDRYDGFARGIMDMEGSHMVTIGHDHHRKRREPLEPYFSRSGVTKLEPMVAELVE